VAFATFATLLALLFLGRTVGARATHHGLFVPRCVVVGDAAGAAAVQRLVDRHPNAGLRILGHVDPAADGAAANAGLDDLEALVERHAADHVLLAPRLESDPTLLRRLRSLRYRGVAIVDFVSLHERVARAVPLDLIDEAWLYRAAFNTSRVHIRRLKRVVDVAVSLVLLVPTVLVVLPLAAVAIKLTSRGPVLFRQERLGMGGRPFQLYKLRTMRQDAERLTGPVWAAENDPRITRVGRFLRKFRIDELPQLFNVLRGQMSIVGPRPEREVFTRELCERQPLYAERLQVPPGVTGWAQVMAPYAATLDDSFLKLQFDLYYAKHLSLFLDLFILLKTAETVLFGRERAQGGLVAGLRLEAVPQPGGAIPVTDRAVAPPVRVAAGASEPRPRAATTRAR
jgi:exopolysaccharide biosynthesis polyprenyl glycosylphosphotransferase